MMNIGDRKGLILDSEVKKLGNNATNLLEIGTYCGYSSIRIARLLPDHGHLYTLEVNPEYANIAKQIIDYAGLNPKITILEGPLSEKHNDIKLLYKVDNFDLVFIDHCKDKYLSDFNLLEAEQFLKQGSVIVADNVLFPGSPDYLEYIQSNTDKYKSTCYDEMVEYANDIKDQVWVSIKL